MFPCMIIHLCSCSRFVEQRCKRSVPICFSLIHISRTSFQLFWTVWCIHTCKNIFPDSKTVLLHEKVSFIKYRSLGNQLFQHSLYLKLAVTCNSMDASQFSYLQLEYLKTVVDGLLLWLGVNLKLILQFHNMVLFQTSRQQSVASLVSLCILCHFPYITQWAWTQF